VPVPGDSVGAQPRASRPRDQTTSLVAFMTSPVVDAPSDGSRPPRGNGSSCGLFYVPQMSGKRAAPGSGPSLR
jgi:hypothetical protein